jgi:hypothetical protein
MNFRWKKLGRVFVPQEIAGRPWLKEFAQAPSALVCDDRVRVYFACRPAPDARGQYVSRTAFVDLDRGDLTRVIRVADNPVFDLGGVGEFDEFGTYPMSVIRHGEEVRAFYAGWTRCVSVPFNVAIGEAVSRDGGETFEKVGRGPVLSYNLHEPFIVGGPKIRRFNDRWYLWYIVGKKWLSGDGRAEIVNKIRVAVSDDGVEWHRDYRNLIPDRIEEDECQASPDVWFHAGEYHMFFCYRYSLGFRGREKGYRIGYASSTDLVNWTRDDSKAGIDVSDEGFDSEMVSYPHVLELDGKVYLFYLGNGVGRHGFAVAERVE